MKIYILSYGGAMFSDSPGTSLLLDAGVLIETPPSITSILNKNNIKFTSINTIYISHLHGDHFWGLPFYLIELARVSRTHQLDIFSPPKLKEYLNTMLSLAFPPTEYNSLLNPEYIRFHDITKNSTISKTSDYSLSAIRVAHTVETYGLIIRTKDHQIFYSADTELFDHLPSIISESDTVFIDASEHSKIFKGHMSFLQVEMLANKYPKTTFYPIHRSIYPVNDSGNIKIPTVENYRLVKT